MGEGLKKDTLRRAVAKAAMTSDRKSLTYLLKEDVRPGDKEVLAVLATIAIIEHKNWVVELLFSQKPDEMNQMADMLRDIARAFNQPVLKFLPGPKIVKKTEI